MAINTDQATLGYVLIAVGLIAAAGIVLGVRMGASGLKLKHLAFPVIAIATGIGFAFGHHDRPADACEPKPGESSCEPGASSIPNPNRPFTVPKPSHRG